MTEPIRVLVNGAKGKMGMETVRAVSGAADMRLVGETDLEDDLATMIQKTQAGVVVDFTAPHCAFQNARTIRQGGVGGVIGTTGFKPEEIDSLRELCAGKSPGMIIAPNFSIGAVLMMRLAALAAKYMPHVEIIELHHDGKKDAPSGTAIKTAQLIEEAMKEQDVPRGTIVHPARGEFHSGIPIHSVRLPGFLAHQEVIFGSDGQTLHIRHDSINRSCFMPGVLLAIREVVRRPGLTYGLEPLLFGS